MTLSLEGLPVFVEVFWKSGAALGAALCVNALLRKKSADVRRLVLSTTVVALLVTAVALPLLPQWSVLLPSAAPLAVVPSVASLPGGPGEIALPAAQAARRELPPQSDRWASLGSRIPGWIPLIWLLGTALLLIRFAVSLRGLRRLRNASDTVSALTTEGGRRVALMQNDAIAAPVTWGVVRPVILVPAGFEQLPLESRNAVLCHELAHVQGYDYFLRGLAEIARAAIWFQPLMWVVRKQLREEQELACDNRVLATGGRASAYAKMLLEWNVRPGVDSSIAVGITHRGCLKRRLHALLDQDLRRQQVAGKAAAVTWLLAFLTALPLAALSFTRTMPVPAPVVQSAPTPVALPELMKSAPAPRVQVAQVRPAPAPQPAAIDVSPLPLPRFSTRVILVQMDATFKDASGKNREDLKAGDFVVTEDGVAQDISVFDFQKLSDAAQGVDSYYIFGYYTTNLKTDGSSRKVEIALRNDSTVRVNSRVYYADKPGFIVSGGGAVFMVDGVTCVGCTDSTGPGITFPVLIAQKRPEYSDEARKAKYSGTVTLQVEVDSAGNVARIQLVKKLGMGLDEKAIEAVQQWKFRPGLQDGKPVSVQTQVDVNFRLL